jgi:hypothetical protein
MPSLSLSRRIGSWRRPENEVEEISLQRKLDEITVATMPARVEKQGRSPVFVADDDDDDEHNVPAKEDRAFKVVEDFEQHLGEAIQFAEREHSLIKGDCNEAQGLGKRTMCCASPGGSFDDSSVVTATKASEPLFIKVVPGDPVKLQMQSWDIVRQNSFTDDYKNKVKSRSSRSMRPKTVEIVSEPPDSGILDENDWEGMKSAVESRRKKQAAPTNSEKKKKKNKFLASVRRIIRGKKKNSTREVLTQCTLPSLTNDEDDEYDESEPEIIESLSLEVVYSNGGDCLMHSDIHREQVIY